jgi:two-component sensor histidine kinase
VLAAESPLQPRTLRQRVGGVWSLAWPTFLITSGLSMVALLATEKGASTSATPMLAWFFAWVCAVGALVVPFVILRHTLFRDRAVRPLPVAVVVAKDVAFAVAYTTTLTTVGDRLGVSLAAGFPEQLLANAFIAAWWSPALAYFMDYRQQVRQTRSHLTATGQALDYVDRQQDEVLARIRDDLLVEVGAELRPLRERLQQVDADVRSATASDEPMDREDWKRISDLLRQTAQDSVRPLSHRIWQRGGQRYDMPPWWMLPVTIIRQQPFRPVALALIDILGTLGTNVELFGGVRGTVLLLVGLGWSIAVMVVANALMRRHQSAHAVIFLGALAVLQVSVVARGYLRELWVPGSGSVAWQLSQMVAVVVVVLVTSGFGAWRNREAAQLANLSAVVEEEGEEARQRSAQIAMLARETAQYLHGSLQTRLVGCSLAMEQASETGDAAALERALAEALSALDTEAPASSLARSVRDEVGRKVDLWDGFCAFDVVMDDDIADATEDAVVVGRVVEEAISNAIRHGHASRIHVSVTRDAGDRLLVGVTDDGIGPQGGSPGLGSAYLAMVSDGTWSIERFDLRTRVVVPIGTGNHR